MNPGGYARAHHGERWSRLVAPLCLAAYVVWTAVTAAVLDFNALLAADAREWAGGLSLIGFLVLFAWQAARDPAPEGRLDAYTTLLQGTLVLAAEALLRNGQIAILLIIVAGQLVLLLPVRQAVGWLLGFNLVLALSWLDRSGSPAQSVIWVAQMIAFQAFAGLTAHYAGASERDRERLAQVNAELLATQCLLEESARGGERLKLSRELHDVAGHKLTALKLNLARLVRDPAIGSREELQVSRQMADELLDDIRAVVSELRAHDGLDLRAALHALARPVAGSRITVDMEDGLRVDDLPQAEALLRCAQESITNALRHGRAGEIRIGLRRLGQWIQLEIGNDGALPDSLTAGNGLTGMRERLEAVGGTLEVGTTPPRGVCVRARLPGSS